MENLRKGEKNQAARWGGLSGLAGIVFFYMFKAVGCSLLVPNRG